MPKKLNSRSGWTNNMKLPNKIGVDQGQTIKIKAKIGSGAVVRHLTRGHQLQ